MKPTLYHLFAVLLLLSVSVGTLFSCRETENDSPAVSSEGEESRAESETESIYRAPDFIVLDENGNEVRLSDYFGKPIVLNFWASWCYYCTLEMPDFDEAAKANPDVVFLMVNVTDGTYETVESAKTFLSEKGYTFPVFYDTTMEASSTYGASGIPMTFFIDEAGDLVTYANGMIDAETLAKAIDLIR